MDFDVTSDPRRFDEAVDWFRGQLPMTDAQYKSLSDAAQRRAFYVGGVNSLNFVADIYSMIESALEGDVSWEDFQTSLGDRLEQAWSLTNDIESLSRLITVFNTNVFTAYSAGRMQQQSDPELIKIRPYLKYDSVRDGRTSEVCRRLDGTILPHDDEFWDTYYPPNHFNCRGQVLTLTARQADGKITNNPPQVGIDKRFQKRPALEDYEPENLDDYPDELRQIAEDRLQERDADA